MVLASVRYYTYAYNNSRQDFGTVHSLPFCKKKGNQKRYLKRYLKKVLLCDFFDLKKVTKIRPFFFLLIKKVSLFNQKEKGRIQESFLINKGHKKLPTVMTFELRQKNGQNRGVELFKVSEAMVRVEYQSVRFFESISL